MVTRARQSLAVEEVVDPATLAGREFALYGVDNTAFCVRPAGKRARVVYEVREDESDGYRSSLKDVVVVPIANKIFSPRSIAHVCLTEWRDGNWQPHSDLAQACVAARLLQGFRDDTSLDGSFEGWALLDPSGYPWLIFGTSNADDYYPSFVFRWNPKAAP